MGAHGWSDCTKRIQLNLCELCGRNYVVDFALSEWRERQDALLYQFYVTDMLNGFFTKGRGKRFQDIFLESRKPPRKPPKSKDVIAKLKRKLAKGGESG